MPSKRKIASVDSNASPSHVTPPTPRKPGKLRSILKRPSPPARFLASTPSAQIKLEFNAAASDSHRAAATTTCEDVTASMNTPATGKKPKLEVKTEGSAPQSTPPESRLPMESITEFVENSAAEVDLSKSLPTKSSSPKYENDGDTEDLVKDVQPDLRPNDEAHLMSGGLGPGESPYKGGAVSTSTRVRPCDRKIKKTKKKKQTSKTVNVADAQTQGLHTSMELGQFKHEQNAGSSPGAQGPITNSLPSLASSILELAESKLEPGTSTDAATFMATQSDGEPAGESTCARSDNSELGAHQAKGGQSTTLADVSKILQDYDTTREGELETLRSALLSTQARASRLETQLGMLHEELASQSKDRQTPCSWQFNRFAIFSRRSYTPEDEEKTGVVAGCDDLEEVNDLARAIFLSEMEKLGSVVEDLGETRALADTDSGMPRIQMRTTSCGMAKCRSYSADSRWDLSVERVSAD